MTDAVFSRLAELIGEVMEMDPERVTPEIRAEDVPNWDSLNHLRLITAVEEQFNIRFTMEELTEFENVGHLSAGIAQKQSNA